MIWLNWMQRGAMIGFWVIGFALIVTVFLPMFALLFALMGKVLSIGRDDDDDDDEDAVLVYSTDDDEENADDDEEESKDGDNEADGPEQEA